MGRRRWFVGGVVVATVVTGALVASEGLDGAEVMASRAEPLPVTAPVPSYAVGTREGIRVRSGDDQVLLRDAADSRWLPSGDLLVLRRRQSDLELVDAASGRVLRTAALGEADLPGRSAGRVNALDRYGQPSTLHAWTADLEPLDAVTLPLTDNPDARTEDDLVRNYHGVAATVGGATFVLWGDGGESYEGGDHGAARVRDGEVDVVLRNERLVALFLAVDGAALLALRQVRGEPCGGCVVEQEVVEIDPVTGGLRSYGHPEEYAEEWRVDAMDKVGDRVAVRYVLVGDGRVPRERNLVGTYVYEDGDWSLLPGSDEAITWWQDGGRVLARPAQEPLWRADGYRLSWQADGSDEEVAVEGELAATFGRVTHRAGAVAGRLLPPAAD